MTGLAFRDLLGLSGVAPEDVNVMLHSPSSRAFALVLPSFARDRHGAFHAFQAVHSRRAAATLANRRPCVASFARTGPGRTSGSSEMLFLGLFANSGPLTRSVSEVRDDPEVRWLRETFGVYRELDDRPPDDPVAWFDLELAEQLPDLRGRLSVETRLTRTYVRLAERLDAPVAAITRESRFDAVPPPWREIAVSATFLRALPGLWAGRLAEWRGVYLIVDETDGARYVGAAYGSENLLGRWRAHVAGDAGVTRELSRRNPRSFRFSILERVSPDLPADDVIRLERTWMERLHTRDWGLNT